MPAGRELGSYCRRAYNDPITSCIRGEYVRVHGHRKRVVNLCRIHFEGQLKRGDFGGSPVWERCTRRRLTLLVLVEK
jgi:hypothetical protein